MKPDDKDKLNKCLEILDSTDLGLSLVWLWTWSTVNNILEDESYHAQVSKDDMWKYLSEAVEKGHGFSLEYGAEQHYEDVLEWMLQNEYVLDPVFEEDDEDLCEICEANSKEDPEGKYCTSCKDDFKESE